MKILAIESSCDETAAAIIAGEPVNSTSSAPQAMPELLSSVVVSQIDIFKSYGGVIPEVAARSHLEAILPVIHQAFVGAGLTKKSGNSSAPEDDWDQIDAIAVTHTPGLLGSLLIGTLTARTLSILHDKPLYAIHHLKSHIYANWLPSTDDKTIETSYDSTKAPEFPLLSLVVSGGHTQIIRMSEHNNFEIIGTTLDDAVGECYDKIAKILGLPYPGGPSIAAAAKNGNPDKYKLPIPQIKDLDFSFSGLKTAVLRAVQKEVNVPISYPSYKLAELLSTQQKADFAASFQKTATKILLDKLAKALSQYPDTRSIVIAGGVSANEDLRNTALARFSNKTKVFFPALKFAGDNAAMVGVAAFYEIASGIKPTDPYKLNIMPRSEIC